MEIMYVISETGYIMIEIYKWLQPECPPATWLTFTLVCIVYGEKCNNGKCNLDHWSASIEAQRKQHFLNDENMVAEQATPVGSGDGGCAPARHRVSISLPTSTANCVRAKQQPYKSILGGCFISWAEENNPLHRLISDTGLKPNFD